MWIGIIILGYFVSVFLLIRFLQSVHTWDDEIEVMHTNSPGRLQHPTHKSGRVPTMPGFPLKGKRK